MAESDPVVAVAVEAALTPSVADAAAEALAWVRGQVELAAVKYEQFAERETNPLTKTAMQFAARIMRAEFLGWDGERQVNGRFAEAEQSLREE